VPLSGSRLEARVVGILRPHERSTEELAEHATVLVARVMHLDSLHEAILCSGMVPDANNPGLARMSTGLTCLVAEVESIFRKTRMRAGIQRQGVQGSMDVRAALL